MERERERCFAVVVGAGFAGLGLAIKLRRAGIDDFVILEAQDRLGGTWRDNVYPGVACDIPAHLYSYSFEPNPDWTRFFAPQSEILAYLERCADKYDLRSRIRFGEGARSAVWDEDKQRWIVTTARGRTIEARALVCAAGIALSRPILPSIPGLDRFEAPVFHSARWDASAPIDGKRIALIGTGASAIQVGPAIAPQAARLYVFQRTPPWVIPRPDAEISPRARRLFRLFPILQKAIRTALYWWLEWQGIGFFIDRSVQRFRQRAVREFLETSVPDPALREKVTPRYVMGCKRVLLSSEWYPTLCRPNVEVVPERIEAAEGRELVTADGTRREVDLVVCATGFEAAEAKLPFDLVGKDGLRFDDVQKNGLEAYLGTTVPGFPSFFFVVGPNTGLGHNSLVFMMESQYPYILGALRMLASGKASSLTVKAEHSRRYNEELQARLARTVWTDGGCVNWYRTKDGANPVLWPGFTWEFRLRTWRFDARAYDYERGGAGGNGNGD
jgi:cation diffusion facilitator CzcD-associated flavoprotein CzcO